MDKLNEIRAGLPGFSFTDYIRGLDAAERESSGKELKPLKIAVLRSYTAEMVGPVLRLRLLLESYRAEVEFGDYNGYAREILDNGSFLHRMRPDIVLLLVRIEEVLPDFVHDFGSRQPADWEKSVKTAAEEISTLCSRLTGSFPCQVILQNMSLSDPYWGAYDAQLPYGQLQLLSTFNRTLSERLSGVSGAYIWDFHAFTASRGHESLHDPKLWFTAKNPYKQSAYVQMGVELSNIVLSALGRMKKCIVVDLDNTLWGGIAGEDGINGIRLGHEYPGNCYREFQAGLLKLYNRGYILAINSKNNLNDALEIIGKHPYMVLRERHFAAMEINWNDKASNMRSLAQDLNIGLESMIFIDDNPAECSLVKEACPGVKVVCLPGKPYLIPSVIRDLPGTQTVKLTDEDRKKGEMYRAQVDRKRFQSSFNDLGDFLIGLGIEVEIAPADSFSAPRIAQLTQKTNQMNMTTRRYTEPEIREFMENPDWHVFSIASKDRFGDNGIVGVVILKIAGRECLVDTFLLSCRVIGREIERSVMSFVIEFASGIGACSLTGEYIPTPKNKPAAELYNNLGFRKVSEYMYALDLEQCSFKCPSFISMRLKSSLT